MSMDSTIDTDYDVISAIMNECLGDIIKRNYATIGNVFNRIPPAVLDSAQELFGQAIKVINGERITPEEANAYALVIEHLRNTNPKKYNQAGPGKDRIIYWKDIRSLASLIDNLGRLPNVPEDQKEYVPILKDFFESLSKERAI